MTFPQSPSSCAGVPAAARPPFPARPGTARRGPGPRVGGWAGGWRGARGPARSAWPRARGRRGCACACARPRRVCLAGGRGAGRPPAPAPARGVQWKARGRTRASARPRPRPAPPVVKLLVVGPAARSVPPACRIARLPAVPEPPRSIKPSSKACLCPLSTPLACNRSHVKKKKKSLTSLFLTLAKILLPVPLARFHSSKLWPCLLLAKTFLPQLLIDLEVGAFTFGGMVSEPAARSLQVMARRRTGVGGWRQLFILCSGQALLKSSPKSPFFREFGNVECGLCFSPSKPTATIKW